MLPRFLISLSGIVPSMLRAIALRFASSSPAKRSHLGSLGKLSKIHPLLILQVDSLRSASFSPCKLALPILLVCYSFAQWLQIFDISIGYCTLDASRHCSLLRFKLSRQALASRLIRQTKQNPSPAHLASRFTTLRFVLSLQACAADFACLLFVRTMVTDLCFSWGCVCTLGKI